MNTTAETIKFFHNTMTTVHTAMSSLINNAPRNDHSAFYMERVKPTWVLLKKWLREDGYTFNASTGSGANYQACTRWEELLDAYYLPKAG